MAFRGDGHIRDLPAVDKLALRSLVLLKRRLRVMAEEFLVRDAPHKDGMDHAGCYAMVYWHARPPWCSLSGSVEAALAPPEEQSYSFPS
jgi:hypothetical protein